MILFTSPDNSGDPITFERVSYSDGHDSFAVWRAQFEGGDDRVVGFGSNLPQAVADLHRQRRDKAAGIITVTRGPGFMPDSEADGETGPPWDEN